MSKKPISAEPPSNPPPGGRKPYVRPAVDWQQEFVALAQTSPIINPCQEPGGSELCNG